MVQMNQGDSSPPPRAPWEIPELPPAVHDEKETEETVAGEEGHGGLVMLIALALLGGMVVWGMRR